MNNPLAKQITTINLIKFTAPTIGMMVIMAFYTMVDGIFVARLVNTDALSAVNIVYPLISFMVGISVMLATGSSAIVGKEMGEKQIERAREHFSMIVYVGIVVSVACAVIILIFIDPILRFLGTTDLLYDYCYVYALILTLFIPVEMLQILFQFFFVTAGKPTLGLAATIMGGIANVVLDYVFIVPMGMGVAGAALATGVGFSIPAIIGLFYFMFNRKGTIYLTKARLEIKTLGKICLNGSSEMVVNLAISVTTILYNLIMMKALGEDGVAAITIVLYAEYLLNAVFLGYSSGVAPLFSYNFGEQNVDALKKLLKKSQIFILVASIGIAVIARALAEPIVMIFAKSGTNVYDIAIDGFYIFGIGFLFMGSNIFASALFTSLSNGKVSALISFLRTFILLSAMIVLLPTLFGIEAIWAAVPVAEAMALIVSVICIVKHRSKYNYY